MKKLYSIFILIVLTSLVSAEEKTPSLGTLPHYSTKFDPKANPNADLSIALKKAKTEKKNVLLVVGGNWCKWCGTFDNFLDDHKSVAKDFYTTFEVVRVYYGNGISKAGQKLLKQFPPLKGTPHFYILDSNAKLLESIDTAFLERGYGYNTKKVITWIAKHKKS